MRRHSALRIAALALAAVAAAFLLAACGGSSSSPGPSPADLQGTTWRGILIRDVAPLADAPPTIRFDRGQASGTTGCNAYGGAYRLGADGSFRIDAMAMTEMACPGPRGTQETAVIDILSHANRLVVVDGRLRISGSSGSITFAGDPR